MLTLAQLQPHIAEDEAFTTDMAYLPAGNTLRFKADSPQRSPKTLGKKLLIGLYTARCTGEKQDVWAHINTHFGSQSEETKNLVTYLAGIGKLCKKVSVKEIELREPFFDIEGHFHTQGRDKIRNFVLYYFLEARHLDVINFYIEGFGHLRKACVDVARAPKAVGASPSESTCTFEPPSEALPVLEDLDNELRLTLLTVITACTTAATTTDEETVAVPFITKRERDTEDDFTRGTSE
jgi:hypothetical protein